MERQVMIYLHFPKTGGVAMTDAFKEVYGVEGVNVFPNFMIDREPTPNSKIWIGHLQFGCHKVLPDGYRARYLAMLRDPVERVYSHWAYLSRQGREERELWDFVRSGSALVDNLQVRMLVGKPWLETATQEPVVTEDDLRQARYNVAQHFDWVGLLEHYEESLRLLDLHLGINLPRIKTNVWTHREPIPEDVAIFLRRKNKFDLLLYSWIKGLYGYD